MCNFSMTDFNNVLSFDQGHQKIRPFHTDPHIAEVREHLTSRSHLSFRQNLPEWSSGTHPAPSLSEPAGTKHKTMLEARTGVGAIKSFPRPGVKSKLAVTTKSSTGLQNKTFYCEICDVHVNSETQLKQVRGAERLWHTLTFMNSSKKLYKSETSCSFPAQIICVNDAFKGNSVQKSNIWLLWKNCQHLVK